MPPFSELNRRFRYWGLAAATLIAFHQASAQVPDTSAIGAIPAFRKDVRILFRMDIFATL